MLVEFCWVSILSFLICLFWFCWVVLRVVLFGPSLELCFWVDYFFFWRVIELGVWVMSQAGFSLRFVEFNLKSSWVWFYSVSPSHRVEYWDFIVVELLFVESGCCLFCFFDLVESFLSWWVWILRLYLARCLFACFAECINESLLFVSPNCYCNG